MRGGRGRRVHRRLLAAAFTTLLAVGMPAESPAREFGVRAVYWFPELSGDVFSADGGGAGYSDQREGARWAWRTRTHSSGRRSCPSAG